MNPNELLRVVVAGTNAETEDQRAESMVSAVISLMLRVLALLDVSAVTSAVTPSPRLSPTPVQTADHAQSRQSCRNIDLPTTLSGSLVLLK